MAAEATEQSLLGWLFEALGPLYIVLLPLSAAISFFAVLAILVRGRGPMAAASLVLIAHIPLLLGVFSFLHGIVASYRVIASSTMEPSPAEFGVAVSVSLIAPFIAMALMVPSYLAAAIGSFTRAMLAKPQSSDS